LLAASASLSTVWPGVTTDSCSSRQISEYHLVSLPSMILGQAASGFGLGSSRSWPSKISFCFATGRLADLAATHDERVHGGDLHRRLVRELRGLGVGGRSGRVGLDREHDADLAAEVDVRVREALLALGDLDAAPSGGRRSSRRSCR
jgi:hypothetical protein